MSEQIPAPASAAPDEKPLLIIEGTVTKQDYGRFLRELGLRRLWKVALLFLITLFLIDIIVNLKYGLPALNFGLDTDRVLTYAGFTGLYALLLLVISPKRLIARVREMYDGRDEYQVRYIFKADCVRCEQNGLNPPVAEEIKYDTVASCREIRTAFRLRTKAKNYLSLYKAAMTEDQMEALRRLLDERFGK